MAGKSTFKMWIVFVLFIEVLIIGAGPHAAKAGPITPSPLRYTPECILQAVLKYKNATPRLDLPIPKIYLGSETTLRQMRDALYPHQWTALPTEFSNAYAYKQGRNEIYLLDDAKYNAKHGRYTDDSLAHELIHFVQVKYQNADLSQDEFVAKLLAADADGSLCDGSMVKQPKIRIGTKMQFKVAKLKDIVREL
jgi:hypothetical protein